jgi:hypothetical protein
MAAENAASATDTVHLLLSFALDLRKTEGPEAYARYMGSSARAEWPTFLPS